MIFSIRPLVPTSLLLLLQGLGYANGANGVVMSYSLGNRTLSPETRQISMCISDVRTVLSVYATNKEGRTPSSLEIPAANEHLTG